MADETHEFESLYPNHVSITYRSICKHCILSPQSHSLHSELRDAIVNKALAKVRSRQSEREPQKEVRCEFTCHDPLYRSMCETPHRCKHRAGHPPLSTDKSGHEPDDFEGHISRKPTSPSADSVPAPPSRLWVTVYDDGERSSVALDEQRIFDPERDKRHFTSVEFAHLDPIREALNNCREIDVGDCVEIPIADWEALCNVIRGE